MNHTYQKRQSSVPLHTFQDLQPLLIRLVQRVAHDKQHSDEIEGELVAVHQRRHARSRMSGLTIDAHTPMKDFGFLLIRQAPNEKEYDELSARICKRKEQHCNMRRRRTIDSFDGKDA